ncbi:MAG TPA: hypothetical protein VGE11_01320 [Pseudonocardia sp.]
MSDVITLLAANTYRAESISDTPIFSALAAAHPLYNPPLGSADATRRRTTSREPAWLSRSCLVPAGPTGGRHRRPLALAEHTTRGGHAARGGRHHLTPSYA